MKKTCPQCNSDNVAVIDYLGIKCVICKDCGFDQAKEYEVYPEEKTSQKAKSGYSPYKAGGHKRTAK